MDPDPDIFVLDIQYANFLKVHLHNFSKKSQKEVTKQQEFRFVLLFLLGERRIRIQIQEAQKHTDPNPKYC
jgi:hypothetical protein